MFCEMVPLRATLNNEVVGMDGQEKLLLRTTKGKERETPDGLPLLTQAQDVTDRGFILEAAATVSSHRQLQAWQQVQAIPPGPWRKPDENQSPLSDHHVWGPGESRLASYR